MPDTQVRRYKKTTYRLKVLVGVMLSVILLLLFLLVSNPESSKTRVKYEVLPISIPNAVGKGLHLPSPDHTHTLELTMGAPNLQNMFNASLVSEQEFPEFDQEILDLLKPYNVFLLRHRIQTVSLRQWGKEKMVYTLPARTSSNVRRLL